MTLKLDRFDDFHLHGASAPAWKQRYQQISCGAMRSSLAEATSGDVHVFHKWMSERVVQQGCLPSGKICFAVPVGRAAGTPRAQGREMRENSLFVLGSGEEFTLQRPPGMRLLAVTFESERFRRLMDAKPWTARSRALLSRPVLTAPSWSMQRLRRKLLAFFERSSTVDAGASGLVEDSASSRAVFEALCEVFDDIAESRQSVGSASASFIVAESHRIVAASADAPPSIDALCLRLRTSRRTLQNSFRQVADTTPVHYLRSLRLDAVRRRLLSTRAGDLSISQAATDQGFGHLSHLAQRYKTLFGELPSQTPRAGFERE